MLNNQMADSQNELLSQSPPHHNGIWFFAFWSLMSHPENCRFVPPFMVIRNNFMYGVLTSGVQMHCQNWFLNSNLAPSVLAGRSEYFSGPQIPIGKDLDLRNGSATCHLKWVQLMTSLEVIEVITSVIELDAPKYERACVKNSTQSWSCNLRKKRFEPWT